VALDVSTNTTGFTYTQQRREDTDLDDGITPADLALVKINFYFQAVLDLLAIF